MAAIPTLILLLTIGCVSGQHHHGGDNFKSQLLRHRGTNVMEGEKHIDTHDQEQGADRVAGSLDHKGKDKSNTNTQAQLTATMNAKDQHQDSYSHLHDNAHETEAMDDQDRIRGSETVIGHENGLFGEIGAPGPHGDLHDDHEPFRGPGPEHLRPTEAEWEGIDHEHYSDLLHEGHDHEPMFGEFDGHHEFGHGGRLDGDMYTGPEYDMFGGNHHLVHGGGLDHHGHHGGDHRHGPMDLEEVPWVAADHF